jgi:hypothetical protein
MGRFFRRLTFYYTAGSMGALVSSLALWLCGANGITRLLRVDIHPRLTADWLYPRIVWGGMWGLLLFLPLVRSRLLLRSALVSLGPTIAQLVYVFPVLQHKGLLGLELGILTPAVVTAFNWLWALAALLWLWITNKS